MLNYRVLSYPPSTIPLSLRYYISTRSSMYVRSLTRAVVALRLAYFKLSGIGAPLYLTRCLYIYIYTVVISCTCSTGWLQYTAMPDTEN
ncbi:hypothetical protein BJX61DRAFT_512998 [Aspergillus egyptiacus]|nr:hypothetical protein BJX61DRAFT_512998 [Aspergillus egyptiacus]